MMVVMIVRTVRVMMVMTMVLVMVMIVVMLVMNVVMLVVLMVMAPPILLLHKTIGKVKYCFEYEGLCKYHSLEEIMLFCS